MPGSRLEIVAGAGHFVQIEQPAHVARLILDFIATTEPAHLTAEALRDALRQGPGRQRRAG
jgi:hypothetical protein